MIQVIALLLALAAAPDLPVHRCGLELLPPGWKAAAPARDSLGRPLARSMATGVLSYNTLHFSLYWSTTGTDAIRTGGTLPDPRAAATGDSVPALVRSAATSLEKAWSRYVDSLGYRAPKGVSESFHWKYVPPNGRYPVEICNIPNAYSGISGIVFGLTIPYDDGSSSMLLASNLPAFPSNLWGFAPDTNAAGRLGTNYARAWDTVMRATAAHELFHAVQFDYDAELDHFLFEASAVAMEKLCVPEELDYLAFADPNQNGLAEVDGLLPLTAAVSPSTNISLTYDHSWYVRQLMQDRGVSILRALWESRGVSKPSIRNTLRSVLDGGTPTYDSTLARYALRLALTGRRSRWLQPDFSSFPDATLFPTLTGTVAGSNSARQVPLAGGGMQVWIDTAGTSTERIVNWLPDAGAALRHAWTDGATSGSEWARGPVRQSASTTRQDAWAFANPGPLLPQRSFALTDSAHPWIWTSTAPSRTTVSAGSAFAWGSGSDTLSGTARSSSDCTPLLYTDIWTPSPTEEPGPGLVASRSGAHSLVLADADRTLSLSKATLTIPYGSLGSALVDRGDGAWNSVAYTSGTSSSTLQLGDLDLSIPLRIVVGPGAPPAGTVSVPRPNPSRHGTPVRFPLSGTVDGATLDILSQDGALIHRYTAASGQTEIVWDMRNGSGTRVRPGVYWYVWRGVQGSVRGKILVAE